MRTAEAQFLGQFGWDAAFRTGCGDDSGAAADSVNCPTERPRRDRRRISLALDRRPRSRLA